jgi:hypothetical protein
MFKLRGRQADIIATVSSPVSMILVINYQWCRCYQQMINAGVIDTVKYINCWYPVIDENPGQGLITGVNNTDNKLSQCCCLTMG